MLRGTFCWFFNWDSSLLIVFIIEWSLLCLLSFHKTSVFRVMLFESSKIDENLESVLFLNYPLMPFFSCYAFLFCSNSVVVFSILEVCCEFCLLSMLYLNSSFLYKSELLIILLEGLWKTYFYFYLIVTWWLILFLYSLFYESVDILSLILEADLSIIPLLGLKLSCKLLISFLI
jgi:hypothetical protein